MPSAKLRGLVEFAEILAVCRSGLSSLTRAPAGLSHDARHPSAALGVGRISIHLFALVSAWKG